MSGALDPIQQDLPLEAPVPRPPTPALPLPLPPSLYERIWSRVRAMPWQRWRQVRPPWKGWRQVRPPWQRWRQRATPIVRGADKVGGALRLAVTRGTPYTIKLARATAKLRLAQTLGLVLAKAIHLAGLPAVVLRTAIQLMIAWRSGLAIEEAVFFRLDDPAGFVVYEAPPQLGTAMAIAYLPGVALAVLSLVCLVPALVPHRVLLLPTTWLTWLQVWLGLAFAAHIFPAYEEAGPLAEQARVGIRNADPVAVLSFVPVWVIAILNRLGGVPPAAVGALALWWLASTILAV